MSDRQMHLIGYLIAGPTWHNNGGWRHPESDADKALDPARYEQIARVLEEGKFDALFFVDVLTVYDTYRNSLAGQIAGPGQMWYLDPMQLLASMARVTRHIGLAGTMSTAFYHPFHIARAFASLDHISHGRAAWNVVTSANMREAQNFGLDRLMEKSLRYDHADEVLEACDALWNSWDADAIVYDRKGGVYADPSKVRRVDYEGKWIRTRGPLTTPRSPQGRPVIMQAGSSERGREFAARWAEVIFTLQHDKADMQAFYIDIKTRMERNGRRPEECIIMPALDIVLGETESIARERAEYLNSLVSAETGICDMSNAIGVDLGQYPMDQPIEDMEITDGARGVLDVILQGSRAGALTLRQAGYRYGISQLTPALVGTPEMVADRLQDMFESQCCDGFVVCPSITPGSYMQFVKAVVPELQRRGVFRHDYTAGTLRGHIRG
ncbi:MAG TPA: LLM class flavin-dependent oxidoreductase [Stellaceae bacterium]|nr:LLM class flavin-dependent oxidoreductase [Stellaceae bacterium]